MPASSPKRKSPRRKNKKALSPTERLSREVQRLSREVKLSRKNKTRASPKRPKQTGIMAALSREIEKLSHGVKASPRRGARKSPRRKLSPEQKLSRDIKKTINNLRKPTFLGGLGDLTGLAGFGGLVKMNQDHKDALKITSLSPTLWPSYGFENLNMMSGSPGASIGEETLDKLEWYSFIAGLNNRQMTVLLKKHHLLSKDDGEVNPYNRLRYFQKLLKECEGGKSYSSSSSPQ